MKRIFFAAAFFLLNCFHTNMATGVIGAIRGYTKTPNARVVRIR